VIKTVHSADGTTIAYERSGTGPAVILVGGALSSRQSARALADLLAPHFTVYAFDRRGRGDSTDAVAYTVEGEVEDLRALVSAAGGSAFVYGHSSGGVLAIEAAARGVPIAKLAVYEPPYMIDETRRKPPADLVTRVQAAVEAGQPDHAAETFLLEAVGFPADVVATTEQSPGWAGMVAVAHTLPYDLALVGDGSMPTARLATIAVPTLVVDGGASPDWARNAVAAVATAIPGARRLTIEGQNHGVTANLLAPALVDFFG
jgi:pimeloyl-ACP methyl ester carboxylesterase